MVMASGMVFELDIHRKVIRIAPEILSPDIGAKRFALEGLLPFLQEVRTKDLGVVKAMGARL